MQQTERATKGEADCTAPMVNGATAKCRMDRDTEPNKIEPVKKLQGQGSLPGPVDPWGQI